MAKRGPKPQGDQPMTAAERQARYRAARAAGRSKVQYRRPADRRSRQQRWSDAVAVLLDIQADCQAWLESLPESFQESSTAEALRAVCELDLSDIEAAAPPRGFGRD